MMLLTILFNRAIRSQKFIPVTTKLEIILMKIPLGNELPNNIEINFLKQIGIDLSSDKVTKEGEFYYYDFDNTDLLHCLVTQYALEIVLYTIFYKGVDVFQAEVKTALPNVIKSILRKKRKKLLNHILISQLLRRNNPKILLAGFLRGATIKYH